MSSTGREFLGIDQGTTNTKVLRVNEAGEVVGRSSQPLTISYPQAAWVEQDPMALWQSVRTAIDECLAGADAAKLAAIAISNQRESVVLWERSSGRPLGPCVVWQCRRSASFCAGLAARNVEYLLRERTGLTIDPLFSASKMRWLLDHTPEGHNRAANGELCLGTVDSWVLWNLTGGKVHACDMTNASRTQLFNLHTSVGTRNCWRCSAFPRGTAHGDGVEHGLWRDCAPRQPAGRHPHRRLDWGLPRRALRSRRLPARRHQGNVWHGLLADDAN